MSKSFPFILLIFCLLIDISKETNVINIFYFLILQKYDIQNKKYSLRHLWDETVNYDASQRSSEERESIEHCRNSNYKYFIHYVGGLNYTFKQFINRDNAVRNIIIYLIFMTYSNHSYLY